MTFCVPEKEALQKRLLEKGENAAKQHFLLFPQFYLLYEKQIECFEQHVICFLKMFSFRGESKMSGKDFVSPAKDKSWYV